MWMPIAAVRGRSIVQVDTDAILVDVVAAFAVPVEVKTALDVVRQDIAGADLVVGRAVLERHSEAGSCG